VVVDYDKEAKINYVPVESQPIRQLKLHTSQTEHDKITESIQSEITKASDRDGLLQLVLEGALPFKKYTEIDFTGINQLGIAQNFYFEYIDRVKPTGEGLQFSNSEGLNPRKRLEEVAQEAVNQSSGDDQKIWQQAMNYAIEYYLKERDQ